MMTGREPTVVAELTPSGRAAVAVVVVAGPNALAAVRRFFFPATPWPDAGPPIGRIMLGRWGGERGEELVVCRRGDELFEIHCHGGDAAAPAIVEPLVAMGCMKLSWREWVSLDSHRVLSLGESESRRDSATCSRVSPRLGLRPAISTTPMDSTTCAAIAALAEATTARTAAVLLDQYHGALSSAVAAARAALAASDPSRAREIMDGILEFRGVGPHLTSPWQVVIAGPPNVGKSSLLNAIAGYQRAIVSPQPGTTRDVVTLTTAINGWPVQFADTAGLRDTRDELESAGVALACSAVQQADLVMIVSDATAKCHEALGTLGQVSPSARVIDVANKIDLIQGGDDAAAGYPSSADCTTAFVSALTGQGIAELLGSIERALVPNAPPGGAAVAFTPSQLAGLEEARAAIDNSDFQQADAALASVLSSGDEAG